MSTKTLLITSVLFGFMLSAAAGPYFADASAQLEEWTWKTICMEEQ